MRDEHRQTVLALAMRYEDPVAYVDKALAAFDEGLEHDPENSTEAVADRRARQLMEEVA